MSSTSLYNHFLRFRLWFDPLLAVLSHSNHSQWISAGDRSTILRFAVRRSIWREDPTYHRSTQSEVSPGGTILIAFPAHTIPLSSISPMLSSSNSSISSRLSSPNSYRGGSDKMSYSLYGQFSHAEATEIISKLKDQSDDELRRLLNDKEAYAEFFGSFPEVKNKSNQVHDEVERGSLQLARNILEKEPHLSEIRNQCMIIRTTELAAAEEKLKELERQKEDTIEFYSLESLLQKLQDAIGEADLESDALQKQLLDNDIELSLFVEKYKSLRMTYHQRSLVHLAAKANF